MRSEIKYSMGGDSYLVSSLAEGSKKAFTALYDKYMGMVYGYVVSIVKDSSLAEDITQQIFIQPAGIQI